jgi:penicillin-binding protein 1A
MKVFTTLNYEQQKVAEDVVTKWIEEGKKDYWFKEGGVASLNFTQAAILAIEPSTGYIKVMVGGVDFNQTQFNRCTQAKRQPGSAFKPVVYLAALERGFSPGSIVEDSPITFHTYEGPYSPINYTKEFLGSITLRKALEQSINVVAIKLNSMIGPQNVVNVGRRLGITSPLQPILSLPLGAMEVTMMELASVYCVFANDGIRVEPVGILKIEDRDGIVLYKNKIQEKRVFDSNLISLLVDMMKGVVDYGTGQAAKLPRPVAGKTGTTSDYKDAWFVGFVPQLVCAVWVGNDDNTPMNKVTGGLIPAQMWNDFMKVAVRDMKRLDFGKPRGLVSKAINTKTGKLASDKTPKELVSDEKFWTGKEPKDVDTTKYDTAASANVNTEKKEEEEIKDFFNIKQ